MKEKMKVITKKKVIMMKKVTMTKKKATKMKKDMKVKTKTVPGTDTEVMEVFEGLLCAECEVAVS
jgi:hypothetical protein